MIALISNNATKSFEVKVDFSTKKSLEVILLDEKQDVASLIEPAIKMLKERKTVYFFDHFSGPILINFLTNSIQNENQKVNFASVLLFPGSINELQPSLQLHRPFDAYANYTMCLFSDQISFEESKNETLLLDATLENHGQSQKAVKLKCVLAPMTNRSLRFNFVTDLSPNGNSNKTVNILFKAKVKASLCKRLFVMHNGEPESKIDMIKFVVGQLKNSIETLWSIGSTKPELLEFRSISEFSPETILFLNETCSLNGWREKYGLQDSLPNDKGVERLLEWLLDPSPFASEDLSSIWNDSLCPIQIRTAICNYVFST